VWADLDPATAAHVWLALRAHRRALARDGIACPPGLAALEEQVRHRFVTGADDSARLAADRTRRWRARRRGEPVALRQPGPRRAAASG